MKVGFPSASLIRASNAKRCAHQAILTEDRACPFVSVTMQPVKIFIASISAQPAWPWTFGKAWTT
jgi:hypothetical protein